MGEVDDGSRIERHAVGRHQEAAFGAPEHLDDLDHLDLWYLADSCEVLHRRRTAHAARIRKSISEALEHPFDDSWAVVFARLLVGLFGVYRQSISEASGRLVVFDIDGLTRLPVPFPMIPGSHQDVL